MNLLPFAVLTLCVHQILGQENVRWSDFSRGSKRYSNERAINYNSNANLSQQKLTVADTADEFAFRRPVKKDKAYDDFLSYLYRGDKAKSKSKREIKSSDTVNVNVDAERGKRMIVFRPLFVYKQQEIKRQRVKEERKRRKMTKKPTKPNKYPYPG